VKLQATINDINVWAKKGIIKVNQSTYTHISFTLRNQYLPHSANRQCCSTPKNEVKCSGMRLDRRLTWAKNIKATRNQLNLKSKPMHWLLGRDQHCQ
jgi:hypothetical protein